MLLLFTRSGYDVSDESFYLMNYARLQDVQASFSMFNVVIKPLYDLSGGNIALLRLLGILILLAASLITVWTTLKLLAPPVISDDSRSFASHLRVLLTLLASAGGALYYESWLVTPSYNWLTLVGLAFFWTGFLLWLKSDERLWRRSFGAALFAFAAAVVFWSKATSAALLLPFLLLTLVLSRRRWKRLLDGRVLLASVVGFALGMSFPLWYGLSFQSVINILSNGIQYEQLLRPSSNSLIGVIINAIGQLIQFFGSNLFLAQYWTYFVFPLIAVFLIAQFFRKHSRVFYVECFILAASWVINLFGLSRFMPNLDKHWILNVVVLFLAFLVIAHYAQRRLEPSLAPNARFMGVGWSVPVFGLIFIYVFGTANAYALQSALAGVFFLLGMALIALGVQGKTLNAAFIHIAVPTLLIAASWMIYSNSLMPYRQTQPILQMDHPVTIRGVSTLNVSLTTAQYVDSLQQMASTAHFQPGTPLIDLSGRAPGAAYVLDARAPIFPWLLSGYVGSNNAALYILKQWSPGQMASAWVLTTEQDNASKLSSSLLAQLGLNFPAGYAKVGELHLPPNSILQALWHPLSTPDLDSAPMNTDLHGTQEVR